MANKTDGFRVDGHSGGHGADETSTSFFFGHDDRHPSQQGHKYMAELGIHLFQQVRSVSWCFVIVSFHFRASTCFSRCEAGSCLALTCFRSFRSTRRLLLLLQASFLTTKGFDHKTPIRTSFDQRCTRYSQLSRTQSELPHCLHALPPCWLPFRASMICPVHSVLVRRSGVYSCSRLFLIESLRCKRLCPCSVSFCVSMISFPLLSLPALYPYSLFPSCLWDALSLFCHPPSFSRFFHCHGWTLPRMRAICCPRFRCCCRCCRFSSAAVERKSLTGWSC